MSMFGTLSEGVDNGMLHGSCEVRPERTPLRFEENSLLIPCSLNFENCLGHEERRAACGNLGTPHANEGHNLRKFPVFFPVPGNSSQRQVGARLAPPPFFNGLCGTRLDGPMEKFLDCNRNCNLFLLDILAEPHSSLLQVLFARNVIPIKHRARFVTEATRWEMMVTVRLTNGQLTAWSHNHDQPVANLKGHWRGPIPPSSGPGSR